MTLIYYNELLLKFNKYKVELNLDYYNNVNSFLPLPQTIRYLRTPGGHRQEGIRASQCIKSTCCGYSRTEIIFSIRYSGWGANIERVLLENYIGVFTGG